MCEPIKAYTTEHQISFSNLASKSIREGVSTPSRRKHAVHELGTAGSTFGVETVWERSS